MPRPSTASLFLPAVATAGLALWFWQYRSHQAELGELRAEVARYQEVAAKRSPRARVSPAAGETSGGASGESSPGQGRSRSLAQMLSAPDPAGRVRALLDFAESVPTAGIEEALRQIREGTPEWDPEAKSAIHVLLTRWAREAPEEALAHLRTLNPGRHGGDVISVMSGIASVDPKRATAWLADPDNPLPAYPFMGMFLAGSVSKEWVRQDPAAALAWSKTLPDSQRTGAYIGLLATLAGTDPASAASLTSELEPGNARKEAIGNIAKSWGRSDPAQALAWAQKLEGPERTAALGEALSSWADTQPAQAAKYLAALDAAETTTDRLKSVVEPWTNRAPADAANWLSERPEGTAKNEAMNTVMWRWTTADPAAASSWLQKQPPGPARDSGVTGLALATFDSDPVASLTWAATITDEKKRQDAVVRGLREWQKRDAAAAKAWAEQNGVPVPK